ncbi:hypothetical protein U4E84_11965 [Halorubrum sp. AD140]|uniref:DUF7288 family protein n=1 Tax=Halorubrum sp. AD140 TaxID=3050073 RepID=UPI002ACC87AE|nr:hypothetical protein [Halorubrum sp. AD140]MDZ5812058.1 hypothetical protein [Halorubrum sp. AD140]
MRSTDDRAQAHTLEAFAAAILLVAGLTFALQATAVTPLSASTSNQHIENQQRAVATDLLATSAENGDLRDALLYWNPENETFAGSHPEFDTYTRGGPPNSFGEALNRTFLDRRVAFNVEVRHGDRNRTDVVDMGSPSDNAVTASRAVSLSDDANLTAPGYEETTLAGLADGSDPGAFYAASDADGAVYDHVEVRITVWRM